MGGWAGASGPEVPSTVAPSSACKGRARSLFTPQTKVAVRMAEGGTAYIAIVADRATKVDTSVGYSVAGREQAGVD